MYTGLCRDVNRSAMLYKIACARTDALEYLSGECRLGICAAKSGIGVTRLWDIGEDKAHVMEHLVLNAVGNSHDRVSPRIHIVHVILSAAV